MSRKGIIGGSIKKNPKEGVRFKRRTRPNSRFISWGMLDEDFLAHNRFADITISWLRERLGHRGYVFDKRLFKLEPIVLVKREGKLTHFRVPFMGKENFRSFLIKIIDAIDDSFLEDKEKE